MDPISRGLLSDNELYICKAPVLLIGFNRPDTMQIVFNEVRKARPRKLYYAVDCAREGKAGETELVNLVKEIIKQVDWACDVHTLFQKKNQGCGYGPAEAISWAFENEDCLIVLEDDCVPSQSFFRFCDEMLERYKNDYRVNIVSGRSHHAGTKFFEDKDYILTHYAHTWGWATWKRAWKLFDIRMNDVPSFLKEGGFINILFTEEEAKFFNNWLSRIHQNIDKECTHSWDAQWVYARLKNGGLGIVPARNLIQNIGEFGTHSSGHHKAFELLSEELPCVLRHPLYVIPCREYDCMHFHNHIHVHHPLFKRIYNRILRWIR